MDGRALSPTHCRRRGRLYRYYVAQRVLKGDAAHDGLVRRVSAAEIEAAVVAQIGALAAIAKADGVPLQHVKPHGALYNMAARDRTLADAIARAIASVDSSLIMFGLPNSTLIEAGRAAGLRVAAEGFADRAYEPNGSLTPRSRSGAVIHDVNVVVARAIRMAVDGIVLTPANLEIALRVDTICVHGDTPGAPELARRIHDALGRRGVAVEPIGAWL